MNLLTIITLLYLAVAMLRAGLRGFTRTLFSMMFLILAIVTTMAFAPAMTNLFRGSENLQAFFSEQSRQFIESGGSASLGIGRGASAGEVASAAVRLALSFAGVGSIDASRMTEYLMSVSATIVTFILSCIGWLLIRFILGRFRPSGPVRALDHVLGVPLGAARALVNIWLVLGLISLLSFTRPGIILANQVMESPLLRVLYENNLVAEGLRKLVLSRF